MMCRHDDRKVGLMFWELLPSVNDTLEQWDVGVCNAKPQTLPQATWSVYCLIYYP